jgi:hypothetical protein
VTSPSSDLPRWTPKSEADIERAIADDILEETHWWDAKQQLNTGKPANRGLAADLAAFSVDGGSILIGLHEDKSTGKFSLAPQPTLGVPEKIESIAASAVDPPLHIETTAIASAADATLGYIVVEIPPSPRAPHQVDGTYYGRGDKKNVHLSDGEVQRLHQRRESVTNRIRLLLDREIARDPIPPADRQTGHVYLVAEPIAAPPGVAVPFLRRPGIEDWIRQVTMVERLSSMTQREVGIPPSPPYLQSVERRGGAMANVARSLAHSGRQLNPEIAESDPEPGLLDVEFLESGGLRVLVGRATKEGRDGRWYVIDVMIVLYARRLLDWAHKYGQAIGFRGTWALGLHVDKLAGGTSSAFIDETDFYSPTRYSSPSYDAATTATTQELTGQPWDVGHRLAEGLVWSLGSYERVKHHLEPPAPLS